jgi:triacylglycerol lipase
MSQLPIVLAHGYLGFGTLGPFEYFKDVQETLASLGAQKVYAISVPPKGSLAERSASLAEQIRASVPSGKVHLIAHSMGGLDARYLIGKGNGSDLVASFTTLGTPFRGTFFADIGVNPLLLQSVGPLKLAEAVASLGLGSVTQVPNTIKTQFEFAASVLRESFGRAATSDYSGFAGYFKSILSLNDQAIPELTTANCRRLFPDDESDLKGIPSSSYAGSLDPAKVSPFLKVSAILLEASGDPNDGLVAVRSAMLKDHRGTLPFDHLGLIGWAAPAVLHTYGDIYQRLPS